MTQASFPCKTYAVFTVQSFRCVPKRCFGNLFVGFRMENNVIPTTFKLPKQTKEQIEYLKGVIKPTESMFPGAPQMTATGVVCFVIHQAYLAEQHKDDEIKAKLQAKKPKAEKAVKEKKEAVK